jgi:hypothetical protein
LGPRGPVPGLGRGRETAGKGRRRRPGTVAAAASCTGGVTGLWGRRRAGELMQVQGKVRTRLVWGCSRPDPGLAAAACSGTAGGSVWAPAQGLHVEGKAAALIGDARAGERKRGSAGRHVPRPVRRRAGGQGQGVRRRGVRRPRRACGVGKERAALGRCEGTSGGARAARIPRWPALARGRRTAAGAGAVGARGSALSPKFTRSAPV